MSSSLFKIQCTVLFFHNRVWAWEQVLFLNPVLNKCRRSPWKLRSLKWCNIFSPVLCLGRATWLQQGFEVGLQEVSLGAALPPSTHTWSGWPTANVRDLLQGRCRSGTVWATSKRGQNNFLYIYYFCPFSPLLGHMPQKNPIKSQHNKVLPPCEQHSSSLLQLEGIIRLFFIAMWGRIESILKKDLKNYFFWSQSLQKQLELAREKYFLIPWGYLPNVEGGILYNIQSLGLLLCLSEWTHHIQTFDPFGQNSNNQHLCFERFQW